MNQCETRSTAKDMTMSDKNELYFFVYDFSRTIYRKRNNKLEIVSIIMNKTFSLPCLDYYLRFYTEGRKKQARG